MEGLEAQCCEMDIKKTQTDILMKQSAIRSCKTTSYDTDNCEQKKSWAVHKKCSKKTLKSRDMTALVS